MKEEHHSNRSSMTYPKSFVISFGMVFLGILSCCTGDILLQCFGLLLIIGCFLPPVSVWAKRVANKTRLRQRLSLPPTNWELHYKTARRVYLSDQRVRDFRFEVKTKWEYDTLLHSLKNRYYITSAGISLDHVVSIEVID